MPHFGISHEAAKLERVMVHHPGQELKEANRDPATHHFEGPIDVRRFISDHQELVDALEEAGVEVLDVGTMLGDNPEIVKQVSHCPNLVFVRDSSTMSANGGMLMRMGLPSRRRETPVIKAAYGVLDIPIALRLEEPETFEGGGFALLEGRTAVAGLCDRTTPGALKLIGDYLLGEKLVDLWITLKMPPGTIHIDGEFAELPGHVAISNPEVLDLVPTTFRSRDEAWEGSFTVWLSEEGWDVIEMTREEYFNMAANFLTVDSDLAFHYSGNPQIMEEVGARGIEVVQIPGEEMRKGLGGIHCMTCPIKRA